MLSEKYPDSSDEEVENALDTRTSIREVSDHAEAALRDEITEKIKEGITEEIAREESATREGA